MNGERVKFLRKARGMSIGDLANRLGYATIEPIYCMEEQGVEPHETAVNDLAKIFGVTTDYLLEPSDLETLLMVAKNTLKRVERLENDIRDITNGLRNVGRIWRD